MPTDLTARIKNRLKELGISEREAARRAGLGLSYVGDILHGRISAPTVSKLEKLAEALQCDVEYLMGRQQEPTAREERSFSRVPEAAGTTQRFIDLYASPSLSQDLWVPVSPGAVDKVQVIPPLAHVESAYAWSIANRLMEPRYFPGEVAYINPTLKPKAGDFVRVAKKDGTVTVARLDELAEDRVTLHYLRTDQDLRLPLQDIETIHRIVGSAG